MLVERDAMIPYPAMVKGSDTVVGEALKAAHRLAIIDRPLGYCYIEHGLNLRSAEHFAMLFANATAVFDDDLYRAGIDGLTRSLPIAAYCDGLATD